MTTKRFKRPLLAELAQSRAIARGLAILDRSVPTLRTLFLILGIVVAGTRLGRAADYIFAAGLLLHFAIWFENWWRATAPK
jgi:hypothetical protein